jgi:hypothetical protein
VSFPRDLVQDTSFIITIFMLLAVARNIRQGKGDVFAWLPFIFIGIATLLFYFFVYIDSNIADIFSATEWSAVLRLSVQLAMLLYVFYAPYVRRVK